MVCSEPLGGPLSPCTPTSSAYYYCYYCYFFPFILLLSVLWKEQCTGLERQWQGSGASRFSCVVIMLSCVSKCVGDSLVSVVARTEDRCSVIMIKLPDKSSIGWDRACLIILGSSPSLREAKAGTPAAGHIICTAKSREKWVYAHCLLACVSTSLFHADSTLSVFSQLRYLTVPDSHHSLSLPHNPIHSTWERGNHQRWLIKTTPA